MLHEILGVSQHEMSLQNTLAAFNDCPGQFLMLLNAIPPALRDSLILGTLAYDFRDGQRPYEGDYQGVYAVGIAIYRNKIRTGEYLNAAELVQLAKAVDDYCEAYMAWKHRKSGLTAAATGFLDHAALVDGAYSTASTNRQPLFIQNDTVLGKARRYADELRKRASASPDPTMTVYQQQSPLYVGCTAKPVKLRTAQHLPGSGLRGTSPLLALTLSCINASLGLVPESVVVPVLQTWTPEQLSIGEQLVTGLSGSLVYEGGLNIMQAGGHAGETDPIAEQYVLGDKQYLTNSGQATLDELTANEQILDSLIALRPLIDGSDDAAVQHFKDTVATYEQVAAEYRAEAEKQAALLAKEEAYLAKLKKDVRVIDKARSIIHYIHGSSLAGSDGNVRGTPGFSSPPQ